MSSTPPYTGTLPLSDCPCAGHYRHVDASEFSVRGADYLVDKRKCPSQPSLCRLLAADFVSTPDAGFHIAPHTDIDLMNASGLVLVINFIFPGPAPFNHLVVYFDIPSEDASGGSDQGVAMKLLRRFVSEQESDEFRNKRLKFIPRITEGPWLVKKIVGNTPAILPHKIPTTYHFGGDKYFEVDVNLGASKAAGAILNVVGGASAHLIVDLAFVIEGQEASELPEQLIGAIRIDHVRVEGAAPALTH
eukprot:m51a1_g5704 hypothetical protein (247) ;mRNA; f:1062638-1063565